MKAEQLFFEYLYIRHTYKASAKGDLDEISERRLVLRN